MTGFLHALLMEKYLEVRRNRAFVCPHMGHKPINMGRRQIAWLHAPHPVGISKAFRSGADYFSKRYPLGYPRASCLNLSKSCPILASLHWHSS